MTASDEDRIGFLKRQGWREDLPPEEKARIEAEFGDTDIDMATELGF